VEFPKQTLTSQELSEEYLASMDCVVIATDHGCYEWEQIASQAKLVFDTRGVTKALRHSNIIRL